MVGVDFRALDSIFHTGTNCKSTETMQRKRNGGPVAGT